MWLRYLDIFSKFITFATECYAVCRYNRLKYMMIMQKQDIRIVYMGTPDFAVPTLDALVNGGYNVVGVITMPDKPAGRGHKMQFSPVKQYALDHNLPLLQPEKLKDEQPATAKASEPVVKNERRETI